MNQQESDLINGLFDRLRQVEAQPRDPQAEALIKDRLARQPAAAYALAQTVIVQEQALTGLQQQIEDLQHQVQQLQQQPPQQSGGFLSGLFGGSVPQTNRPMMPRQPAPPSASGPWGSPQPPQSAAPGPWGAAQQAAAPRGGSGFLATAAATAVGIGGGILAANAISSMFSGAGSSAQSMFEDKTASATDAASATPASADASSGFGNLGPAEQGFSSDLASGYDDGGFGGGFDSSDA